MKVPRWDEISPECTEAAKRRTRSTVSSISLRMIGVGASAGVRSQ